jgi:hypothetical protein
MDPNEALRLIRLHIAQMRVEDKTRDDGWIGRLTQQGRDLAETFEGLDEWLSKGGFPPTDWPNPEVIPFDLRLSFTPDAIREHFEGDEPDPTEGMTDEELADVGRSALCDDILYREFHQALVAVLVDEEED